MDSKIKIAILDTGININHEDLSNYIVGGISFMKKNNRYEISEKYMDDNGHGTLCASVIKKECSNVEFFIIKVLDKNASGNLEVLECALNYLKQSDIRLINMSFALIGKTNLKDLKKICKELEKENKILICSLANGYNKSYPAVFKSVLGVRGFILENEKSYWFCKNKKIQAVVDYNEYLHCNIKNTYSLFGVCNSFAAAKMTGIVAGIMYSNPNITKNQLYKKLREECTKKWWSKSDFKIKKHYPSFMVESVLKYDWVIKKLEYVLGEYFKINDLSILKKYILFSEKIGLNKDRCYDLLKLIENKFEIKFKDYTKFSVDDFCSIYTLSALIINELSIKESN